MNRRGSRSEGRINITVQDRLAESVRLKKDAAVIAPSSPIHTAVTAPSTQPSPPARSIFDGICNVKILKPSDMDPNRLGKMRKFTPLQLENKPASNEIELKSTDEVDSIPSIDECDRIKFLVDSATVQLPAGSTQPSVIVAPKFKTMPSPTRNNNTILGLSGLNEIYEEGTDLGSSDTSATATPRLINRHTAFTAARSGSAGSHRRTKFHKSRTTSCSSSDDDDSESRKKRAHKMVDSTKPFPMQRRDSNDDSSDSQDPNPSCGGGGGSGAIQTTVTVQISTSSNGSGDGSSAMDTSNQAQETTAGRQRGMHGFRRHRTSRCRNNEIRLRESQSLNRITEVQDEDRLLTTSIQHANRSPALSTGAIEQTTERSASPSIASAQSITTQPLPVVSKPKSFGARLLAGFKRNTNHESKQSNGKTVDESKSKYNNNNDGSGNKVPSSNGKQHAFSAVDATNNPINWIKNSKPPLRVKAQQRFKNLKCLVDIFS